MSKKIAIISDDKQFCRFLDAALQKAYELAVVKFRDSWLEQVERHEPDLVLVDVAQPEDAGNDICRQLRSSLAGDRVQIVRVMAESFGTTPMEALEAGADDCIFKPVEAADLLSKIRLHLQLRDALTALTPASRQAASYDSELERLVARQAREIVTSHNTSILELTSLAEAREDDGGERLVRMRYYSLIVARQLSRQGPYTRQVDVRFLDHLYRSIPLHDIGRIGISHAVLSKRGPLLPDEIEMLAQHTVIGAIFLSQVECDSENGGFLAMAAELARTHHEWFDGTGYPDGLAGESIPLPARIVAVADAYDELTSTQAADVACTPEIAQTTIAKQSGTRFDPAVVEAFLESFDEIAATQAQLAEGIPMVAGAASFLD